VDGFPKEALNQVHASALAKTMVITYSIPTGRGIFTQMAAGKYPSLTSQLKEQE
jgi:hypothetical protein